MKDGKYSQVLASGLNDKLCGDLEGLKKIWAHRGLCHFGDLGSKVSTTLRPQLTVAAPWVDTHDDICTVTPRDTQIH